MKKLNLLVFVLFSLTNFANTYYVSTTGNNSNPGTESLPWRTIQYAADMAVAGDTIYIFGSIYDERVYLNNYGTPGNPIVFLNYPGEAPIIDWSGTVGVYHALFEMRGYPHDIKISGLAIQNSEECGILGYGNSSGDCKNIIIENCTVLNSYDYAIYFENCENVQISSCHIEESGASGIFVSHSVNISINGNTVVNARNRSDGHDEFISIADVDTFETASNEVYYQNMTGYFGALGIDAKQGSSNGSIHHNYVHDISEDGAIYIDAYDNVVPGSINNKVFNNKIENCKIGISIGTEEGGTINGLDIYNNIIIDVKRGGISFHDEGPNGTSGVRKNVCIYHNTIYSTVGGGWKSGILLNIFTSDTNHLSNINIDNNIVRYKRLQGSTDGYGQICATQDIVNNQSAMNIEVSNNITTGVYYGTVALSSTTEMVTDPLFVDSLNGDFHLLYGSPAIDAGVDASVYGIQYDYDSVLRPQLNGFDMGAFEFLAANVPHVFYVSTTGNNSNPGTESQPWLTIQYGLDNIPSGDTLIIMSGTYNEKVNVQVSDIVIKNYPEEHPVLDGLGLTYTNAMIEIENKSDITIEGLEIANNMQLDAQGILIEDFCRNIIIKNCKIHDIHFSNNPNDPANSNTNAQPIIVFGSSNSPSSNIIIENNEIYDCRLGYSEALAINGNVDTFLISGNTVHDVTNIGIVIIGHEHTCQDSALDQARNGICTENITYKCNSPYAANGGIYIDGAKDIIVEKNTCYRNIWGIEVGCEHSGKSASNITVRNNVIYRNAKSGLALGGYDYPSVSGKVIDCNVYNNTLFDNDTLNDYEAELNISYAENCNVTNNIIYARNTENLLVLQYSSTAPVNVKLDSNIYYHPIGTNDVEFEWQNTSYTGLSNWQNGTGQDANTIFDNPGFINSSTFPPDLHLSSTSPAIETGSQNGITTDRDGVPRPLLSTWDKGAYEYGIYWTGEASNYWHTAGNWSNSQIPVSADSVTIPSPEFYLYYPIVTSNVQIKKIYLYDTAKLEVLSGVSFRIE